VYSIVLRLARIEHLTVESETVSLDGPLHPLDRPPFIRGRQGECVDICPVELPELCYGHVTVQLSIPRGGCLAVDGIANSLSCELGSLGQIKFQTGDGLESNLIDEGLNALGQRSERLLCGDLTNFSSGAATPIVTASPSR